MSSIGVSGADLTSRRDMSSIPGTAHAAGSIGGAGADGMPEPIVGSVVYSFPAVRAGESVSVGHFVSPCFVGHFLPCHVRLTCRYYLVK